ncbi:hypothetical protein [Roseibium aggregatum]|uniref:hypothetical protein n=1 Tax=Roseibium aggregatum TaxID=187304 RepID=UPI0025AD7007|nr:hypothetical protein [Roseibium aggregatum]WJS05630.1 hypothetical protein QUB73_28295 [Roseibium aggregatum]
MLSNDQYGLLFAILDEIIPAGGERRIPSAGVKAVADGVLSATATSPATPVAAAIIVDAVVVKNPAFADLSEAERVNLLKEVEQELPQSFAEFVRVTYMVYYSRPEIRPLLGVGAHPVHPEGYHVERESKKQLDELTAPVRARGRAFRLVRSKGGAE